MCGGWNTVLSSRRVNKGYRTSDTSSELGRNLCLAGGSKRAPRFARFASRLTGTAARRVPRPGSCALLSVAAAPRSGPIGGLALRHVLEVGISARTSSVPLNSRLSRDSVL